jgi:hypothetical protein
MLFIIVIYGNINDAISDIASLILSKERAGEYTFFYGKWNENHEIGTGFFVHKKPHQRLRRWSLLVIACHT